jgi:hypothetical protein
MMFAVLNGNICVQLFDRKHTSDEFSYPTLVILNSNKSWKVLIRGKTVNPGKIGLDELYNLDSVFEIVRQMKYCRAVPEVVKSKENLAYLGNICVQLFDRKHTSDEFSYPTLDIKSLR